MLLFVTYALGGLMVSSIKYFSFKETELYRRQPFWILIAIIVLLKLVIAEPQIMLFAGFLLFALSGPMRWLFIRGKRLRTQLSRRGRPLGAGRFAAWRETPSAENAADAAPVKSRFRVRARRSRKANS